MLDGELIVEDEKRGASFSGLQSDLKGKRHNRMVYVVFDLLYCNGFDLMAATQLHRKAALHVILAGLPSNSAVKYSEHIDTSNEELLQNACRPICHWLAHRGLNSIPYSFILRNSYRLI